jgi:DNA primase
MDVLDVLQKMGYTDLQDFGKEYRTCPLYRPSDNRTSLCIKKTTGEWYDFSERIGGSLAQLVQRTLQLPSVDAAKDFLGDTTIVSNPKNRYELSSMRKFDKELLVKLQKDHSYWFKRGISAHTIELFQGGITFNGRMAYRYVFPIFDEKDNIVGFSGRRLNDNPEYPKWKHLGAKSGWCYPLKWNADVIATTKDVIIVESIGDMLALWDNDIKNTLVTFGVDISLKIIQFLLRIDIERIFIAFNNDEHNNLVGNDAAEDGRLKLLKFFDPQQVIIAIPEAKDFGEMTKEEIDIWKQTYLKKS